MDVQDIKQRFGIIGNSPLLERAISTALQVAPTDISVLITGESGTGKEIFSKIVHQMSARKHGPYIAVNCGAIPEGTIDSELFGHEKGSFTGAYEARKGYFEVANNGTIFLDEVAELPLSTQVRLLRVLETGEFIKVGSSKPQKTNVRIVAATNMNMPNAVSRGKFREDLYYRLNTVPIYIPSLKTRKDDIVLLFRKFASDFAEKYRMPQVKLDEVSAEMLRNYPFPGNVRQLKNLAEQISILEENRNISAESLATYLPQYNTSQLPAIIRDDNKSPEFWERELLYKVLFDMKKDLNDLKKLVFDLIRQEEGNVSFNENNARIINNLYGEVIPNNGNLDIHDIEHKNEDITIPHSEYVRYSSLSIADIEVELIKKSLEKHNGKRKVAAAELGISERTLYRKIKEHNIEE